ncbi:MAG: oligoendopeptidase F [Bacillota bacterium]|nr:oligoendopeptidase F [Bacillota bacterium]
MKKQPERSEVPEELKWRLEDIFCSDEEWEKGMSLLSEMTGKMSGYKGKLGDPDILLEAMGSSVEAEKLSEKVYAYAKMRRDEDNANMRHQAMAARALSALVKFEEEVSYMAPELLAIPEEEFASFFDRVEKLMPYKRHLYEIVRKRRYVLSEKEERILALSSEMADGTKNAFSMLNNADIKFGTVIADNEEIEITHARFGLLMRHPDRNVRKETFEVFYRQYEGRKNTLSALLSGSVKGDLFYTRARGYESTLAAALFEDNVPVSVYQGLIEAVNKHIGSLHRYISLRKKAFNIDKVHLYDLYAPIAKDVEFGINYVEASRLIREALAPLGSEYAEVLDEALCGRWIDVMENRGKTSGAYSWGLWSAHPFMLLNWQDNLDNAFILVHELGHAMHSRYSSAAQPYIDAHYKIFVAEVASTVNEALMMAHLIKNADSKEKKAMLLNHHLESFRTTFFRQTMFAEFEADMHAAAQRNEPLTAESIGKDYTGLNSRYHGQDMEIDPQVALECLRVPHFYNSFYVYKYATGFASAIAISRAILEGEAGARERYIDFLKAGGSDYPLEILKKAGVDLTTDRPIMNCINVFDETLSEFEKLLG